MADVDEILQRALRVAAADVAERARAMPPPLVHRPTWPYTPEDLYAPFTEYGVPTRIRRHPFLLPALKAALTPEVRP